MTKRKTTSTWYSQKPGGLFENWAHHGLAVQIPGTQVFIVLSRRALSTTWDCTRLIQICSMKLKAMFNCDVLVIDGNVSSHNLSMV